MTLFIVLYLLQYVAAVGLGVYYWHLRFGEVLYKDVLFYSITSLIPVSLLVNILMLVSHFIGKTGVMNKRLF